MFHYFSFCFSHLIRLFSCSSQNQNTLVCGCNSWTELNFLAFDSQTQWFVYYLTSDSVVLRLSSTYHSVGTMGYWYCFSSFAQFMLTKVNVVTWHNLVCFLYRAFVLFCGANGKLVIEHISSYVFDFSTYLDWVTIIVLVLVRLLGCFYLYGHLFNGHYSACLLQLLVSFVTWLSSI